MTPIERAALALKAELCPISDNIVEGGRTSDAEMVELVGVVLRAIREPSEAMENAWRRNPEIGSTAKADWQAMIDAALEEGDHGG